MIDESSEYKKYEEERNSFFDAFFTPCLKPFKNFDGWTKEQLDAHADGFSSEFRCSDCGFKSDKNNIHSISCPRRRPTTATQRSDAEIKEALK